MGQVLQQGRVRNLADTMQIAADVPGGMAHNNCTKRCASHCKNNNNNNNKSARVASYVDPVCEPHGRNTHEVGNIDLNAENNLCMSLDTASE